VYTIAYMYWFSFQVWETHVRHPFSSSGCLLFFSNQQFNAVLFLESFLDVDEEPDLKRAIPAFVFILLSL